MKLTISNIAWTTETENEALALLKAEGVTAIEIAPNRIWEGWQFDEQDGDRYRQILATQGLSCSSMHALLFQLPDLQVFGTTDQKVALVQHLKRLAHLAVNLGAKLLVFGAFKNRDPGELDQQTAMNQAADLFAEVAEYYHHKGVCLCLEATPAVYGCRFIINTQEAAKLVRMVNSPGFRLHLDSAAMFLAEEDVPRTIAAVADLVAHVHISEPNLGDFAVPKVNHVEFAKALHDIGWNQWIAIEMRATDQPLASVKQAIATVRAIYEVV